LNEKALNAINNESDEPEMSEQQSHLRSVACIVNPGAAKKKWLRRKKLHRYLKKNLPGQKYDQLAGKEKTIELARELSARNETIVAVGGDGTVADVLQGIRESERGKDIILGIIPLGSGNAFRKSLCIPKNIKKAIRVLYEGEAKEISLMDVEGRVAGFASIGATAQVSVEKLKYDMQGLWSHLLAGRIIPSLPRWDMEVDLEDGIDNEGKCFAQKRLRLKVLDCIVAKSNYFGYSWRIAPMASLEDDYLDITFFEMSGRKYPFLLPFLYFGLYQRRQKHYKARKMIIRGKNLPIQYHGELLGVKDKVEVTVLPRAVKAIFPPKAC
jgi:diacylglycerol kinase (ATP)